MRFLILNFYESPENYHLERVLSSILLNTNNSFLIIHNFQNDYSKLSTTNEINRFYFNKLGDININFDLIISIDFPWKRDKSYLFYLNLLNRFKTTKKIIISNHLCPDPGQSAFIDDSRKYGFLNLFKNLYILEYDDKRIWPNGANIKKRRFAIDTDYYTPLKIKKRFDIVLFGSKSREFYWIEAFIEKYSIAIITSSNLNFKKNITLFKLEENIFNIRKIINESKIMAIPIKEDEKNPACGNTATFLAMSCGIVPLIRNTPYMRKYIDDGKTGFLYNDKNDFNEKLKMLLNTNFEKLSIHTRDAAIKNASLKSIISEIISKEVR